MTHYSRALILALVALLAPSLAIGQALTNISSTIVRYNTRKATVKPQGELKAHRRFSMSCRDSQNGFVGCDDTRGA